MESNHQIIETRFVATPEKGEVSAILLRPQNANSLIVLGHGAGAGMKHRHMEAIAEHLAAQNIATFRYQFPYMERGGGGRDGQKVSLATVRSAVTAARELVDDLPLLAGGHSFGGRMTYLAAAAEDLPEVKGLIFFSFPLHAPGKPGTERAAELVNVRVPMLFLSGDRDIFAKSELLEPLLESLDLVTLQWLFTGDHGWKILKRTRTEGDDIYTEASKVAAAWIKKLKRFS